MWIGTCRLQGLMGCGGRWAYQNIVRKILELLFVLNSKHTKKIKIKTTTNPVQCPKCCCPFYITALMSEFPSHMTSYSACCEAIWVLFSWPSWCSCIRSEFSIPINTLTPHHLLHTTPHSSSKSLGDGKFLSCDKIRLYTQLLGLQFLSRLESSMRPTFLVKTPP